MSVFKRLSATMFSRLDHVVGEIEDHDAVIEVSMKEMGRKIAEARVRLARIDHEREQVRKQVETLRADTIRWRERAVEVSGSDEDKALACLSRVHHCEQQSALLLKNLERYDDTAARLGADIRVAEDRLRDIRQRRSLMRARQSTSEAIRATHADESDTIGMLEKTFDRWEVRLGHSELVLGHEPLADPLEREFLEKENREQLRAELADLLNRKGG